MENLKEFLDFKANQYNAPKFIETDPISIPHLFTKTEDREIAGFLAATIAWGQRAAIIGNATKLMKWMDYTPHDFIINFKESDIAPFLKFVHRTFNGDDCAYFLWSLKNLYQKYGKLESAFCNDFSEKETNVKNAIINFRQRFLEMDHQKRIEKHIANPDKNATTKRLNMFLRWMVRTDNKGVDFGIWNRIKPTQLVCPLDVHSARVARKLGLLKRNVNDWKAALELTENLKLLDNCDPVKYDFALFGLGIFEDF